jgi:HAMP domain-containing protein
MNGNPNDFATRAPRPEGRRVVSLHQLRPQGVAELTDIRGQDHQIVTGDFNPATELLEYIGRPMVDPNEIEALKASMRGTRRSAETMRDLAERVEALDPHAEVPDAELDELQRLTLSNAVASQALRGFVETMLRRRGKLADAVAASATGDEEP